MIIGMLIMWAILGLFVTVQLNDEGYLDDLPPKTIGVVALICGPITMAAFGFGWLMANIRDIIDLLTRR